MMEDLMNIVGFHENIFVWLKGASSMMAPLNDVEGTFLDFNLYFRVMVGEFMQTYEVTTNDESPRLIDSIALGPNDNLQGGIMHFSLAACRALAMQWKDVHAHMMHVSATSRVNCMCEQKKEVVSLNLVIFRI